MTTKGKTDAVLDAAMNATTPAAFARAIGKDGRAVRNVLRSRFGAYVSKGDPFTDTLKRALYAYVVEGNKDAVDAWNKAK